VLSEPRILAYRSSMPVPAGEAARIAAELARSRGDLRWVRLAKATPALAAPVSHGGPPQILEGEIRFAPGTEEASAPSQADVLWLLCQLARFARDLRTEFEVELAGLRGRVSTGGLDAGARSLLAAAPALPAKRRLDPQADDAAGRAPPAVELRQRLRPVGPRVRKGFAHAG
jgi:hypothetical protein